MKTNIVGKLLQIFGKHVIFATNVAVVLLFLNLPISFFLPASQFSRYYLVITFIIVIVMSIAIIIKIMSYRSKWVRKKRDIGRGKDIEHGDGSAP